MATRFSLLAGKEIEYEDQFINQNDIDDLREKLSLCKQDCEHAEKRWANALNEVIIERTKREAIEQQIQALNNNLTQVVAERDAALMKCDDMCRQLDQAECCAREAEDRANKAEVIAAERGDALNRMSAMPEPEDNEDLLNAIKQVIQMQNVSNTVAPLPAFKLSFTRGTNGLIKSPVTATPIVN